MSARHRLTPHHEREVAALACVDPPRRVQRGAPNVEGNHEHVRPYTPPASSLDDRDRTRAVPTRQDREGRRDGHQAGGATCCGLGGVDGRRRRRRPQRGRQWSHCSGEYGHDRPETRRNLHARVSTDEQRSTSNSMTCARSRLGVGGRSLADRAISGTKERRPELDELVVPRPPRWGRSGARVEVFLLRAVGSLPRDGARRVPGAWPGLGLDERGHSHHVGRGQAPLPRDRRGRRVPCGRPARERPRRVDGCATARQATRSPAGGTKASRPARPRLDLEGLRRSSREGRRSALPLASLGPPRPRDAVRSRERSRWVDLRQRRAPPAHATLRASTSGRAA
jgi:hypothetical protein